MLTNIFDLDLRLIRVFLAVVDSHGVSAAQARLNVGQSTISTQLNSLETRLGYRLCERGRAGFRLTAKGEKFADAARRMMDALDEFGMQARNLDKRLVGTLAIGLMGHTPAQHNHRLAEVIRRFRQRDEAVRLELLVRTPGELEEMLLNGAIQVALGYFWRRVTALHYTPLMLERQLAYCAPPHPLFDQPGEIEPEQAADYAWAWRDYPVPPEHLPLQQRNIMAVTGNMEAMSILILSGQHLGYLPEEMGRQYEARGQMRALNRAKLAYDVGISVVTHRSRAREPIVAAFLDDLKHAQ
ncbi:LysR family transcriptional regulator [Herbaspirillum seropedicae]|uniref:LysR family transcription regulator protein n=1 Tax=Herbaspirillum seropedicae (strain SmR1) TaxID=757424 RepID=D8IQW9_HERSS|nr:LysR family transcriptional regulator [Herbaspirillum seropedicae]ADJ63230.1 LysR family transcription regulator protein [Herbaspirillum seropedicae SmR1]AKN65276.1 LysR family transcriptional regulator [Herbaspirillum seropedicae]NQE31514.1 LysR family transcriptional regulator [Herbaspirillum seropedicae]UMU21240.1 LysR family transcriptional regulator [Herbaspirillum seropedicae]